MKAALICIFLAVALAVQHTSHASLTEVDPPMGVATTTIGSACTQKPDWTKPSEYACRQPCRFAEPITYLAYRPTTEGSCRDARQIVECDPQPPFCDNAADCVGSWSSWSSCDATCGGGIQSRHRELAQGCLLACWECSTQWRTCNSQPCTYDCEITGEWTPWSDCSLSCYDGVGFPLPSKTRSRSIIQGYGGVICTPDQYMQVATCTHIASCPVDCVLSSWGVWTDCNVQCGCGFQTRERKIIVAPNQSGQQCGPQTDVQKCNCDPCSKPCVLSEWTTGPCMGGCIETAPDGSKIVPERVKTRYVIQEEVPYTGGCATPCETMKNETCTWLPPCDSTCELSQWSAWSGNCTGCVRYGSPVPALERFRDITKVGNGLCGCTKEVKVCDLNWCCEECQVSDWSAWGACLSYQCSSNGGTASGIRTRERHVVRPNNPCGRACPNLVETTPCDVCCPLDCKVSEWTIETLCGRLVGDSLVPLTCGPDPGIRRWKRTITPGNACGVPCPTDSDGEALSGIEYKDEVCYPAIPCCPQDCKMSAWTISECFGCGVLAVAYKSRTIIQAPACGGQSCCSTDCCKFMQIACPNPPPCPQEPCIYGPFGDYDNCASSCTPIGATPNQQCRFAPLIEGPAECPPEKKDCFECNGQCCPINCEVGSWSAWSTCSASCGHGLKSRFRSPTVPSSCGGAPCPTLKEYASCEAPECPVDCVVSEWSYWTLCPSCAIEGGATKSERYRTILRSPSGGGASCPTSNHEEKPCPNKDCDRDCVVGEWSTWATCSVICGDGYQIRTRVPTVTQVGEGLACPPLEQTKWCHLTCARCIYAPPQDFPCDVTCSDGSSVHHFIRRRNAIHSNTTITVASTGVELQVCPTQDEEVPCILPCCPQDCVVSNWGPWGECVDGVRNRTRTVIERPSCNGAPCPSCYLEKDECPYVPPTNECEYGQACEDGFSSA